MHLQLADNGRTANAMTPEKIYQHMLAIPREDGGFMWVREDQLDHLPDDVALAIMQQQPHMSGIRDWWQRRKERKAEEKQAKWDYKLQKQQARGEILSNVAGKIGGIIGGGEPETQRGAADFFPQVTGGLNVGVSKWWQNPMVIGGLALALVAGVWVVTKTMKK